MLGLTTCFEISMILMFEIPKFNSTFVIIRLSFTLIETSPLALTGRRRALNWFITCLMVHTTTWVVVSDVTYPVLSPKFCCSVWSSYWHNWPMFWMVSCSITAWPSFPPRFRLQIQSMICCNNSRVKAEMTWDFRSK